MSLNLYQRINEIKKEIKYIKKDAKVQSYTAVSHDLVTASTRELFIKHGVICLPSLKQKEWINASGEAKQGRYDAIYIISFINIDDPKDCFSIEIGSQGLDSQDKAPGKTLSMAKKMAVLKVLDLESGDAEESRYSDKEDFDIDFHLKLLSACVDLKELESQYKQSINDATIAKDAIAITKINRATNKIKEQILKEKQ